jgi:hypothetical protein
MAAPMRRRVEDSILRSASLAVTLNAVSGALRSVAASNAGITTNTGTATAGRTQVALKGTSYNQGAVNQELREVASETAARSQAIQDEASADLAEVATLFQRNTMDPGDTYAGAVVIEAPRKTACAVVVTAGVTEESHVLAGPCRFQIFVEIDGEIHVFDLNEVRAGSAPAHAS